jgi:hypothetical protein
VGTTEACSAVLEVDVAFDLEDSYQGMPSGIPKPDTTVEERRLSPALKQGGWNMPSGLH